MSEELLAPRVLDGLKDFQRATVEHVFQRLYLDPEPAHRFLVADEVGLGKTLVARGIVAKTIDYLRGRGVDQIDIVYICSNADIAAQNIRKVNVTGDASRDLPTRITLIPIQLHELKSHGVNFVSLTPGTSFDLGYGSGRMDERVLLYWLLRHLWGSKGLRHAGVFRLLRGGASEGSFRWQIDNFEHKRIGHRTGEIDPEIVQIFARDLADVDAKAIATGGASMRDRLDSLASQLRRKDRRELGAERNRLVGELRAILARSCVDSLEPDLIILDEFQRFRHLLEDPTGEDDQARALAHQLFNYESADGRARTLLLSATPYKMYTLADEKSTDDHYQDFARTTDFLLIPDAAASFRSELRAYREGLVSLGQGSTLSAGALRKRRRAVENRLRSVMVRTERLAVTADRSGMLTARLGASADVTPDDVHTYVTFDAVCQRLGTTDPIEYWKSTPYPLSFMQLGYDVKRRLRDAEPDVRADVEELVRHRTGLIQASVVARYGSIEPGSGRLRALQSDLLGNDAWRLLWIPPSLGYYRARGAFASAAAAGLTKRLIFSAWAVVPQAVASLLSYEAERRMMRERSRDLRNTTEERQKQRALLQFRRKGSEPASMSTFSLVFPGQALSRLTDPLSLAASVRANGTLPSATQVQREAVARIRDALRPIVTSMPPKNADDIPDEDWYWAAPVLLERRLEPAALEKFLGRPNWQLLPAWVGREGRKGEEFGALGAHVDLARKMARGGVPRGPPPKDLAETVALIGLASPANVALRALGRARSTTKSDQLLALQDAACRVSWGFRSLFSPPEVMSLIRGRTGSQKAYWRKVLGYAFDGDIQAVMDEYCHVLPEWLGLLDRGLAERSREVGEAIHGVMSIRAALYGYDPMDFTPAGADVASHEFRARFAVRFGVDSTDEQRVLQRSGQVRAAFNSPFWPFVLVTTSVGQEGLDFHHYCHAVVHWNLPANPVDLEQREGRVHRYKGHAIRRNVAAAHGRAVLAAGTADPWSDLFVQARQSRKARGQSELIPYWVYEGRHKIERYVPALPLSKEHERLGQLLKSLAVYRLAFGQPRQEDLVALLRARLSEKEIERMVRTLRIDLSPPAMPES